MSVQRRSTVTINSDMGESLGLHTFGNDEALMGTVDVINVACGFHAGDPGAMDGVVALAADHSVKVGAHPGLPDLVGFGRREMKLSPEEVESLVRYQVGALAGFCAKYGVPLNHLKPHGSLYGMVAREDELMAGVAKVAADYGIPVYGLAGTAHERVARDAGVDFVAELYVDLNYDSEGRLIILRKPVETQPEAARDRVTRALVDNSVEAVDGTVLHIDFDTVCVHSDAPNSPQVARAVRAAIDAA